MKKIKHTSLTIDTCPCCGSNNVCAWEIENESHTHKVKVATCESCKFESTTSQKLIRGDLEQYNYL